jgi:hypothetical protein
LLGTVNRESNSRLQEVGSFLRLIGRLGRKAGLLKSARELTSAKGLFFVHLYAAYEYTVLAGLRETYSQINLAKLEFKECHSLLLTAALDRELTSFVQKGNIQGWKARRAVFEKIGSTNLVEINESVNPAAGRNLAVEQLQSIWDTLRIKDPMLPNPALMGRVAELVQNRINVSHGNSSASDIGRRYTVEELRKRHRDIELLCTHILNAFEDYIKKKHYKC